MDETMITDMIEKLTEILFYAGQSSPKTLWRLRHWFKDVRQWAGRKAHPEMRFVSQAGVQFLEKMILDRASGRPQEQKLLDREEIRNWLLAEMHTVSKSNPRFVPREQRYTTLKNTCVL